MADTHCGGVNGITYLGQSIEEKTGLEHTEKGIAKSSLFFCKKTLDRTVTVRFMLVGRKEKEETI